MEVRNWAGNQRHACEKVFYAVHADQVVRVVKDHPFVRVKGSGHGFSAACLCAPGQVLIDMRHLDRVLAVGEGYVTVEPGVRIGALAAWLAGLGLALPQHLSLTDISLLGAVSNYSHGSGPGQASLASYVIRVKYVDWEGVVREYRRGDGDAPYEVFVASLGALGVVLEFDIRTVPAFEMAQRVYLNLPVSELKAVGLDGLYDSVRSASLFTEYREGTFTQAWFKYVVGSESPLPLERHGATRAGRRMHPAEGTAAAGRLGSVIDPATCSAQGDEPAESRHILPHFPGSQPSIQGFELQSEYFVPYEAGLDALGALFAIGDQLSELIVAEVRVVAADNDAASPFCGRKSLALHFTCAKTSGVPGMLEKIEGALGEFRPRFHWGKLVSDQMKHPRVMECWGEGLAHFRNELIGRDPERKFSNEFLDKMIRGVEESHWA